LRHPKVVLLRSEGILCILTRACVHAAWHALDVLRAGALQEDGPQLAHLLATGDQLDWALPEPRTGGSLSFCGSWAVRPGASVLKIMRVQPKCRTWPRSAHLAMAWPTEGSDRPA